MSLASVTRSHVPAIAFEPRADIFAERQAGVAFNGDVIVVVDPAEVRKLQVSGQRGGFAGNSFHHVAVAADGVDVVIEESRNRGWLK